MQLPAPARECSDAEIDAVIDYWDMRRQPQPLEPMPFVTRRYEAFQAAHAASEYDDDLQVARGVLGWPLLAGAALFVGLIALAVALWPK